VRVWIDVDNSPQARYLLPIARRFEQSGDDVLLTARAHGDTFAILRSEGAVFEGIGVGFGKGLPHKLYGLARRVQILTDFLREQATPVDVVLTGSRAAMVVARRLRLPSFAIIDYEHVNLHVARLSGTQILYPHVIGAATFVRRGVRPNRLVPFEGLKEDISFADQDLWSIPPHDFDDDNASALRVLLRPPAEDSHYFRRESRDLALEMLRYLANEGVEVVFSPREPEQLRYLAEVPRWRRQPIVLERPVPFVSLLKGVDAVVSAGGTMLREAAYLGVPAYSVFRGESGAVDRYLSSIGRLSILTSPADFPQLRLTRNDSISPLGEDHDVAGEVMRLILARM
jgi:predicted glycosyltransferase